MLALALTLAAATTATPATTPAPAPSPPPLVEQVETMGFYQLETPSWAGLDAKQKRLAYWLSRAAIAIDPIIYDQLSTFGIPEKRLLSALVEDPGRLPPESREAILRYAKLFFAHRGNHNRVTNKKFVPELTFEQFADAAHAALNAGARLGTVQSLDERLAELKKPLFDLEFEPSPTVKTPPAGMDIITASSNTFYGPGVKAADFKTFKDKYPLNSRVIKENGQLAEQVYRAGTPDGSVKPGLYAWELGNAIEALSKAAGEADEAQAAVIHSLIRYYETGDPADWHAFNVKWVQNDAPVDFFNGFIETYRDARSAKGASEAMVSITDQTLNPLMQKLASNALYFEQKAPWDDLYRKLDVTPPVGKAVEAIVETGDLPVTIIGDNLPNEEEIHRQYGTKNFLFTNASDALQRTRGEKVVGEFMPKDAAAFDQFGQLAANLQTAMHEIIGHGSGKSHVAATPRESLREYYSTLEEARADLMGYWNAPDPKLADLGVKNSKAVAREIYAGLARLPFGVLAHYPTGNQVEEDHDRDRLLIWNWVAERGGVGLTEDHGKHYAVLKDFDKAHKAVGQLLAELMRIKGEGDYKAIKALVAKYGLHFDPKLRDEVVARYKTLGLPTYGAGIYGDLSAPEEGLDVGVTYPRDFLKQQVEHARLDGTLGF